MKHFILPLTLSLLTSFPVYAGGTFSFQLNANSGQSANAIRTGLGLYAISRALEGRANITQNGTRNSAGIGQFGSQNYGVIQQNGTGHTATLSQQGNHNSYGIFQFGDGTNGHVKQGGGGAGVLLQWGW